MKQLKYIKHTTDNGLQLELRPVRMVLVELAIGALEAEMRADGEYIDPPTFTVEMAENIPAETFEHVYDPENNINTLEDPDGDARATQLNYARWRRHEKALAKLEVLQTERRVQEMFKQGVEFEMNAPDGWEDDVMAVSAGQAKIPPESPENEADRAFLWLWYTQLSQMDVQTIHLKLMVLSQGQLFTEEQFRDLQDNVQSKVASDVWTSFVSAFGAEGDTEEAVDTE